jgi:hypothetical protein
MSEARREITGNISGKYESGSLGVKTVSTGAGDKGGVSYGKHQLASNTGTMAAFLKSKFGDPYRARFGSLVPGSKEFSAVYTAIANERPLEFETNQFLYIASTHYDPQAAKLKASYIDVYDRHVAVRECVFSVSVQYGPNTSFIIKALGPNFKGTDREFIEKVQNYRASSVGVYFKSSSKKVQDGVASRAASEKKDLLALLNT